MGVLVWWRQVWGDGLRRAIALVSAVALIGVLGGCGGDRALAPQPLLSAADTAQSTQALGGGLSEVSPPQRIQDLKPFLDVYEPQVRILSPRSGEILETDRVSVQVRGRDLPIYKDQVLGFGPHLHLILDDQPPRVIYAAEASIELTALTPGTHTLRLLAVRPWDESFKNEGAFDAISFDVFAATPRNGVNPSAPLLTYGQAPHPYGAEPILLDFYLTNTPLHLVAEADEAIADWRIRCTINGQSFVFDQWQPIYLKGFKPGKNWIKLELIDETGQLIANAFNPAVQVIDYDPDQNDPLAQLIRGEIPLEVARRIVDPSYEPPMASEENTGAKAESPTAIPEAAEPETPAVSEEASSLPDSSDQGSDQGSEVDGAAPESLPDHPEPLPDSTPGAAEGPASPVTVETPEGTSPEAAEAMPTGASTDGAEASVESAKTERLESSDRGSDADAGAMNPADELPSPTAEESAVLESNGPEPDEPVAVKGEHRSDLLSPADLASPANDQSEDPSDAGVAGAAAAEDAGDSAPKPSNSNADADAPTSAEQPAAPSGETPSDPMGEDVPAQKPLGTRSGPSLI